MVRIHKKPKADSPYKKYFWIGGIVLISVILLIFKNISNDVPDNASAISNEAPTLAPAQEVNEAAAVNESLEEKLDQLILAKEPTFVFFHSNNCQLCLQMIDIVNEVYPEYQDQISLVDINVYDDLNKNLLARANIHSIPTQIFFNEKGEAYQSIGLMSADQLREAFDKIAGQDQ